MKPAVHTAFVAGKMVNHRSHDASPPKGWCAQFWDRGRFSDKMEVEPMNKLLQPDTTSAPLSSTRRRKTPREQTRNIILSKSILRAGGMAQAEEPLPSKYQVLSSNPSTAKI
jgi:hypothetical protein